MREDISPRNFISMQEDTSLVWRKSKIIMQEGRGRQGKAAIRISLLNIYYCPHSRVYECMYGDDIYYIYRNNARA